MGMATSVSDLALIATFFGIGAVLTRFALLGLATYVALRTLNVGEDEAVREHRLAVLRAILGVLSGGPPGDGTAGR
jgi:hypothetical protein